MCIILTFSAPASLSVCKFSLHYPHKISCLVMRTKPLIINSNLSKMKNKFSQLFYKETIETVQENSVIHHITACLWLRRLMYHTLPKHTCVFTTSSSYFASSLMTSSVNPVVLLITKYRWFHAELFLRSSFRSLLTYSSSLCHRPYSLITHCLCCHAW